MDNLRPTPPESSYTQPAAVHTVQAGSRGRTVVQTLEGHLLAVGVDLLEVGQVGGSGEFLRAGSLDHQLLADVTQRVGDLTRRHVTPKHVTHVSLRRLVTGHVRKVPETVSERTHIKYI